MSCTIWTLCRGVATWNGPLCDGNTHATNDACPNEDDYSDILEMTVINEDETTNSKGLLYFDCSLTSFKCSNINTSLV
uniref:Uncharacterized protein n=1 Tax=Amphimedon queenslandica TaxID=400682 RepID=A0A1X7UFA8_AMPQE